MGRKYVVRFSAVAVTAAQDLFEIKGSSTKPIRLLYAEVSQYTDEGDAQAELLAVSVSRYAGSYTSGSGGSTSTPEPLDEDDTAASFSCEINNTTRAAAGSGSLTKMKPSSWNVMAPWVYFPTPEQLAKAKATSGFIIGLDEAPADSITCQGYAIVEED